MNYNILTLFLIICFFPSVGCGQSNSEIRDYLANDAVRDYNSLNLNNSEERALAGWIVYEREAEGIFPNAPPGEVIRDVVAGAISDAGALTSADAEAREGALAP